MKHNPLKSRHREKRAAFYRHLMALSILAAVLGFSIFAWNSGHSAVDSAKQESVKKLEPWNLLAVTDTAYLAIAKQIQKMQWGEWTEVNAFYPNQVSYQWLSGWEGPSGYHEGAGQSHTLGARSIPDTTSCVACHYTGGFEQPWNSKTDLGGQSDYEKPATRQIKVRAAYDEDRIYLWAQWPSKTDASGRGLSDSAGPVTVHQTFRFDGEGFGDQGMGRIAGPKAIEVDHVDQLKPGNRFNYEDRLTVMSVPAAKDLKDPLGGSFNAHGCFMACHGDLRNMPRDQEKVQKYDFAENPILGEKGMNVSDLRHYILRSRNVDPNDDPREHYGTRFPSDMDSFEDYLSQVVVPDLEKGNYIDLWQARTGRSIPMGHASADYIHAYRLHNNQHIDASDNWAESGTQNWFNNRPNPDRNHHMQWIYDARKTGYWAIHENELAAKMRQGEGPLITEGKDRNAIHLTEDALFLWDEERKDFRLTEDVTHSGKIIASKGSLLGADLLREGDLVPRRALQKAEGARSTVLSFASWNEGVYNVVFVRERDVQVDGKATTDHSFDPETGHTMAFSIFDDHASNRSHYVTFPMGLIDEKAGEEVYHANPAVHDNTPVILARNNEKKKDKEADAEPVHQQLVKINQFEGGAFDHPDNCAACHQEIHDAWSKSKHRYAWEDPFYQPDYLLASRETEGFTDIFCGECHAPVAVRTQQLPPPDGSLFDATAKKGVSCDYCHTVKEVVEPVNVKTISDPGRIKRGPRGEGESPYHEMMFSKVHTESAFCGACHNVVHPTSGAVVIDTFADWEEGPYAKEGTRCQDCHMTPGPGVEKNPGKSSFMGSERDHVPTHFFPGGSVFFQQREGNEREMELAKEMLQAAAELETEAHATQEGMELVVKVKNVGAGHKIPTGVTYIRKMWLEVTVTNGQGKVLHTSGQVKESNHVDPDTIFYHKVFRDEEGNLTPKSWLAEEIAYDRRIPAKGHDVQSFSIALDENETTDLQVTVRLLYRSMSQEAADQLGIDGIKVPEIEMARSELSVTL